MIAAFEALRDEFRVYGMQGISMALVCAAILYCVMQREKEGENFRKLTGYGVLFFVLIANPFGYHIIHSFWVEDYWKLFMILLPAVFVAVAVVNLTTQWDRGWKRALTLVCCAGIVLGSSFFYVGGERMPAVAEAQENRKELELLNEVILTSEIVPENMIAPRTVLSGLREINPTVRLLYGEPLVEEILNKTAEAEDENEQAYLEACTTIIALPDAVGYQIQVAEQYGSNCIVLERSFDEETQMEKAGFFCYGKTENYAVYFKSEKSL